MFRNWKFTYLTGGFAPFMDAADAGGAGGGADLSDAGDGSQPSGDGVADGDAGAEAGAAGEDAGREDDLETLLTGDDEDDQGSDRPADERIKALVKKNRKIRKQLMKLLPLSKRLEGVDLDDLVLSKRQFTQLSEQIRNNPRLRALINGDADEPEKGRRTPAAAEAEEQFDDKTLPFDPDENPTNRYFANLAKENFETRKLLKKLQGRLDGVDGRETARTESQVRQQWKTTIETAAAQIKSKGVQTLFKDNLASLFRDPAVRSKYTAQQLVSHYLKELEADGLITREEARATAAAAATTRTGPPVRTAATQQRIAEQNKTLPRTVATTGTPAPARSDKPTLSALRKQVAAAGR